MQPWINRRRFRDISTATIPMIDIAMKTVAMAITITGVDTLECNGTGLGTNEPPEGGVEEGVDTVKRKLGAKNKKREGLD